MGTTGLSSAALTASAASALVTGSAIPQVWAVDSGATDHMCHVRDWFATIKQINPRTIRLGDRTKVTSNEAGLVYLHGHPIWCLSVPSFRLSLLSIPSLDKAGWRGSFGSGQYKILDTNNAVIWKAPLMDGLYRIYHNIPKHLNITAKHEHQSLISTRSGKELPAPVIPTKVPRKKNVVLRRKAKATPSNELDLWHRRMAHTNTRALTRMLKDANINIEGEHEKYCITCILSKSKQKFQRKVPVLRSTTPFELVHSDLSGPFNIPTLSGKAYYIVYICDCTRFTKLYLLNSKSSVEICTKYRHFRSWVKSQGYSIRRFRSDNGTGEYDNAEFHGLLIEDGTQWEPSPPHTQSKNGTSEAMIREINTKIRSMLIDAGLPGRFWGECAETAVHLHQRTPTKALATYMSPYEALYGTPPQVHHMRRFGCLAYRHIKQHQQPDNMSKKFGVRSSPCMMLGYVHRTTKIWRLWDFSHGAHGRAFECSNVIFVEDQNAWEARGETYEPEPSVIEEEDYNPEDDVEVEALDAEACDADISPTAVETMTEGM